jgi:4-hydroxy-3-polyprenylbenzoate decarboxylase
MASNLFGSMDRVRYIFRDTLPRIRSLMKLRADPAAAFKQFCEGT